MNPIIDRIISLLKSHNMTAKELTQKLGLNKSAVSEWKSNKIKPSIDSLIGISLIFDVSLDWLLTGAEPKTQVSPQVKQIELPSLSIDEETILENYRDMTQDGKRIAQRHIKSIRDEHKKPSGALSNSDLETSNELMPIDSNKIS